jgi:hypothetical protein
LTLSSPSLPLLPTIPPRATCYLMCL